MSIKKNAGSIAVFILLFVISFIFIIPFIWTMLTSLKPDEEIYSSVLAFLPVNPYLGHYTGIFTKLGNFFKYFSNSVVVSFWSVLFNVLFAATLGYSFSKFQYWGRDLFLGFVLLIITLPYVIYLIPIYIMQSRFDLIDTRLGLILPYIATNLPMSVFIMRGQFNGVPNEMMEAARIDGAGQWQTFSRVMLPTTAKSQTLAVGITFLRDEAASWQYGTLTATIILSLIPVLAIFLSMQKYFIKGIMAGAVKG